MIQKHPFEARGLGKAPFRVISDAQDFRYGEVILNRAEYERTGLALTTTRGGTCSYCGAAIVNIFTVESSDGKRSTVGCDCVRKVGGEHLVRQIDAITKAQEKAKRVKKALDNERALETALEDVGIRERLSALPHPTSAMAEAGHSMLDWANWMASNAGAKGRAMVLKCVKKFCL